MKYRGESCAKALARPLIWTHAQSLLGSRFTQSASVFLAGQTGCDIPQAMSLGIPLSMLYAVESDREAWRQLSDTYESLQRPGGLHLIRNDIVYVVNNLRDQVGFVYLDYCGTVNGPDQQTTHDVVKLLSSGTVLSITHERGRTDRYHDELQRQLYVWQVVQESTSLQVIPTQGIMYQSTSPMMTLTYYLGPTSRQSYQHFTIKGNALYVQQKEYSSFQSFASCFQGMGDSPQACGA
jgi:hypothetical protein